MTPFNSHLVLIEQERQYKPPDYEATLNFFLIGFNKDLQIFCQVKFSLF